MKAPVKCPICEKRGKPCERFVSAAHIFKHYGVTIPPKQGDLVILSRYSGGSVSPRRN